MSARTRNCARAPVFEFGRGFGARRRGDRCRLRGRWRGERRRRHRREARRRCRRRQRERDDDRTVALRWYGARALCRGCGRHRDDDRRRRFRRFGRRSGSRLLGRRRDPRKPDVVLAAPQRVEQISDVIEIVVEGVEELRRRLRRDVPVEKARLHQVRELAQAHRAGHPRAALERVQRAPQLRGQPFVGRAAPPSAHLLARLREELRGLVEEDRQHLRVDVVANVHERVGHRRGQRDVAVAHAGSRFRQFVDRGARRIGFRRRRIRRYGCHGIAAGNGHRRAQRRPLPRGARPARRRPLRRLLRTRPPAAVRPARAGSRPPLRRRHA